jgi:hypothetical protein
MLMESNPEDFNEKYWLVYIQEQLFLQFYIVILDTCRESLMPPPLTPYCAHFGGIISSIAVLTSLAYQQCHPNVDSVSPNTADR